MLVREAAPIEVQLRIDPGPDPLSGTVQAVGGAATPFAGRVELATAIEASGTATLPHPAKTDGDSRSPGTVPTLTHRLRTKTVCGALVALALAGCGGSSSTSSTGTLSKSEFVSEANAICAKVNSARGSIGTPTSTAQAVSAITKLESAVQPDLAQMQSLAARAPSDIKADYDHFVAQVGSLVALLPGIAQAAKSNNSAKAQQLQTQFQTLVNQGKATAKSAGLGSACTS